MQRGTVFEDDRSHFYTRTIHIGNVVSLSPLRRCAIVYAGSRDVWLARRVRNASPREQCLIRRAMAAAQAKLKEQADPASSEDKGEKNKDESSAKKGCDDGEQSCAHRS